MSLPSRWPRKPPADHRCDAHTGSGQDFLGAPVVYRCENLAVETVIEPVFGREMWLCEGCVEVFASHGKVVRNPRVYGAV